MKVTAIISDELIEEVKEATGGKNITESITIALNEYLRQKRLKSAMKEVREAPLSLAAEPEIAYNIRSTNRNR